MTKRLNEVERANRALTGAQWQAQICEMAVIHGWAWCHWRPAQTKHGWRTPCEGPLGKGFPDLMLVKPGRGALFIEVKREIGDDLSADQVAVHAKLREAGCQIYTFRPSGFDRLMELLR